LRKELLDHVAPESRGERYTFPLPGRIGAPCSPAAPVLARSRTAKLARVDLDQSRRVTPASSNSRIATEDILSSSVSRVGASSAFLVIAFKTIEETRTTIDVGRNGFALAAE
jgi:hypothetical protein